MPAATSSHWPVEARVAAGLTLVPERRASCSASCRSRTTCAWARSTACAMASAAPTGRSRRSTGSSAAAAPRPARRHAVGRRAPDAFDHRPRADGPPRLLMLDEPAWALAPRIVRDILHHRCRAAPAACRRSLLVEQNARLRCRSPTAATCWRPARSRLQGSSADPFRQPARRQSYLGLAGTARPQPEPRIHPSCKADHLNPCSPRPHRAPTCRAASA